METNFFIQIKRLLSSVVIAGMAICLPSCGDNDGPDVRDGKLKRTVLLYAVASNDLYSNLIEDKNEMLSAAGKMDMREVSMLVYEVTPNNSPRLSEISRQGDGKYGFNVIKEYDKSSYSTDPRRISDVIRDAESLRPADNFGLILWSHGTGIDPSFSTHSTRGGNVISSTSPGHMAFSFGSDNDRDKNPNYSDKTDIDELADAIPDGMFDFIWFDACYMGGIEMAYELRNKCERMVAYPTEVYTPGMPYHLTMPYFLRESPDLEGAAKEFFDYYADSAATVAVMDMNKIEAVAEACAEIYPDSHMPDVAGLQKYTTQSYIGPFYDFGQVTRLKASGKGADTRAFDKAISEFVVWKAATDNDFRYRPIEKDNFSGISCYLFNPASSSEKDGYCATLDWYARIYGEAIGK